MQYLKDTTDSDLVVVFGENSAAVLGLALAIVALGLAAATGDGRWDGIGSAAIGLVLVGVAVFLATEVSSLLLGERADPDIDVVAREVAKTVPEMEKVLNVAHDAAGPGRGPRSHQDRLHRDAHDRRGMPRHQRVRGASQEGTARGSLGVRGA